MKILNLGGGVQSTTLYLMALRVDGVVVNRNCNDKLYLHKSCRPLKEVHLTDGERGQSAFNFECEGGCSL